PAGGQVAEGGGHRRGRREQPRREEPRRRPRLPEEGEGDGEDQAGERRRRQAHPAGAPRRGRRRAEGDLLGHGDSSDATNGEKVSRRKSSTTCSTSTSAGMTPDSWRAMPAPRMVSRWASPI